MKLTLKEVQDLETEMLKEIIEICDNNNIYYFLTYGSVLGAVRHSGPIPWDDDVDITIPYNQLSKFITVVRKELSNKFFLDYHDINKYYTATFPRVGVKGYSSFLLHVDVFLMSGISNSDYKQRQLAGKLAKLKRIHYFKNVSRVYRDRISFKRYIYDTFFKIMYLPYSVKKVREKFDRLCSLYPIEQSTLVVNPSLVSNKNEGDGFKSIEPKRFYGEGIMLEYSNLKTRVPENYDKYLKHWYGDYMKYPSPSERKTRDIYVIKKLEL